MPTHYGGYGSVWQSVMRKKDLTPESKAIYAYLCSFAGSGNTCFPTVELMCEELGMGADRFHKHMKLLQKCGIVKVSRQRNGTKFGRNLYELAHTPDSPCTENQVTENQNTEIPRPGNQDDKTNSHKSNILKNNRKKDIYMRVCDLLNQAKGKARSKGRVKYQEWTIDKLHDSGISLEAIAAAAQELADIGKDVDWYSFADYCKAKGHSAQRK